MNDDRYFGPMRGMPEEEAKKKKIYEQITKNEMKSKRNIELSKWKELALVVAICCIGFFLFIMPSVTQHQSTTGNIKEIFSYYSNKDEAFRARASTLYIGVENVTTDEMVHFFELVEELEPIASTTRQMERYDIIVVKNGKQIRYQLTENYLWNMEQNVYYPGYAEYPTIIEKTLSKAHFDHEGSINYTIHFLIAILTIHLASFIYYKRRNMEQPKVQGASYSIIIYIACIVFLSYYDQTWGPIFKPLILLLIVLLGVIHFSQLKRNIFNPHVYKIEKWKLILIIMVSTIWLLAF
ncbi:MAG: hypothetical protein ABS944_15240 [Solibacillus sp.]|uniref:hypothetical protein n=1 Tax=Solibacillus sp. TaxID=1909654 RepID=UPI00331587C8